MRNKKRFFGASISILNLLFISSCNELKEETEETTVFNKIANKTYFKGNFYVSSPSIEEFSIKFPVISDKEIKQINDINFYSDNKSNIFKIETYDTGDSWKINDNLYGYIADLLVTANDIDNSKVNKISMNVDGTFVEYDVDLNFYYYYKDPYSYINNSIDFIETDFNDTDCIVVGTIFGSGQCKFNSAEIKIDGIEIQDNVLIRDHDLPGDTAYTSIKNDNTNLSAYYNADLKFGISYEGIKKTASFFNCPIMVYGSIIEDEVQCVINNDMCLSELLVFCKDLEF